MLAHGDTDNAIKNYTYAITILPTAEAYYDRGKCYMGHRNDDLALSDFNNAIVRDSKYRDVYVYKYFLDQREKNESSQIEDLNGIFKLDPDDIFALNERGVIYYNNNDTDLALQCYNKVLSIYGNYDSSYHASIYNNRAAVFYKTNRLAEAEKDYNMAIALNPAGWESYPKRGNLYKREKRYAIALIDFNKADSLHPGDASILAARASVYLLLKNLDAACKDWNAALKSGSLESREYIDKYCNGKT